MEVLTKDTTWQKNTLQALESKIEGKCDDNDTLTESSLIILQGEAGAANGTKFDVIGSVYATTCNMVFLMVCWSHA